MREFQKNVLLAAASGLVALGLAEAGLRLLWHPAQEHTVIRADPVLGWSLAPKSRMHSIASDRGLDYHIEINAAGRRDRERDPGPGPGIRRVLFLGDSFVFGAGVEAGDRCTEQLERALGPGIEVVNAGVSGWGTDQEFLYLCREGLALEPHVVVVGFCMLNDVLNDMLPHELFGVAPKPRFELQAAGLRLLPPAPRPPPSLRERCTAGLKHSRLLHFIGRHLRLMRARWQVPPAPAAGTPYYEEDFEADASHWSVYRKRYSPRFEAAFEVTETLLASMADSCRARGATFLVAAFPQQVEVDSLARRRELHHYGYDANLFDLGAPYARLRASLAGLGVPFVYPIAEARRAAGAGTPLFFAHDGHPNAASNALMAQALAPVLREMLAASGGGPRSGGAALPVRAGRAP